MQLYDMHSHILPAFDDGAKTIEDSLALIDCLKKQGVSNICLTPHYYTNERSLEDFLTKRQQSFDRFRPYIPEDVNIVLGAEVYVTDYLFNNDDLTGITYGNSRYILTEYPYNSQFGEKTMQKFYALIQNHRFIPVIPHVERYRYLTDNPDFIEELKDIGVIIQTNVSNYADKAPFFKKRRLMKLIDAGLIDILGTDAHSFSHNTPELYTQAVKNITEKCGRHRINQMMDAASVIFNSAV